MFNAIRNFFGQIRALWTLPGFCAVLTHKLSSENSSAAASLRNQIAALRTHVDSQLTGMANNHNSALANLHVRLADVVHNASNATLYEAQILRRMKCGSCRKDFAGRKRFNADGLFVCPDCAVKEGLD